MKNWEANGELLRSQSMRGSTGQSIKNKLYENFANIRIIYVFVNNQNRNRSDECMNLTFMQ